MLKGFHRCGYRLLITAQVLVEYRLAIKQQTRIGDCFQADGQCLSCFVVPAALQKGKRESKISVRNIWREPHRRLERAHCGGQVA